MVRWSSAMEKSTKANGKITKCMERECSPDRTGESMKGHSQTIRRMAMGWRDGLMGDATKENSMMGSSTAEGNTGTSREKK